MPRELLDEAVELSGLEVAIVESERFAAIADSHVALCASGTATLEVGLLGTPMVMVYRLASWTYLLARLLVRLPNVALVKPGAAAGGWYPELIQGQANPERIAAEAARLLTDSRGPPSDADGARRGAAPPRRGRSQRPGGGRGGGDAGGGDVPLRKMSSFFWHYLRGYTAWAVLAAAGILVYAAATAGTAALIKPIFAARCCWPATACPGLSEPSPRPPRVPGAKRPERGSLGDLKKRLNLAHQIDSSYESLKRRLGVNRDNVVYFVPILFVVVFLLRSLADFVSGYAFQHIGLGVTTDVRNDLYRRILQQSSRFHAEHPSGELVARVINDVALMQNAVANRLLDLFQQSFTLVALLALLLSTHFKLALISLVAAPVLLYPIIRFGKGMRRTSHRSQERMADLASLMTEGVRGHRVVKAFGMEEFELNRFREATRRHLRVNLWAQMLANSAGPVVESLAVVGAAGLLIYAGKSIRAGELSAPELVQFLTTLLMLYDPIRKLNKVNLILQEAMASGQRVARLMEIPDDIQEKPGARRDLGRARGHRLREGLLLVRGASGAARRLDRHPGGRDRGAGGAVRSGQVDAGQSPAPLLRSPRRGGWPSTAWTSGIFSSRACAP